MSKPDYSKIPGLILDEKEARKRQPKTRFTRLTADVRIGINPSNRSLVFLEIQQGGKLIKVALPVVNMKIDTEGQVWDELNEENI